MVYPWIIIAIRPWHLAARKQGTSMKDEPLPPELQAFANLLDALPLATRTAFHYCLCLMMVEAGKMRLVQTMPGDDSPVCLFEASSGEQFSVSKPRLSPAEERELMAGLRQILEEEGGL
jgi:hypothetical protein